MSLQTAVDSAVDDLDQVVEQYRLAAGEFAKGNPEPVKKIFSHRKDATLANLFFRLTRGWEQLAERLELSVLNLRDGEVTSFENVAKYATPDLTYEVEVERWKVKVGGRRISPHLLCGLRASFDLKKVSGRLRFVTRIQ
jgi:hypothetical protein